MTGISLAAAPLAPPSIIPPTRSRPFSARRLGVDRQYAGGGVGTALVAHILATAVRR